MKLGIYTHNAIPRVKVRLLGPIIIRVGSAHKSNGVEYQEVGKVQKTCRSADEFKRLFSAEKV